MKKSKIPALVQISVFSLFIAVLALLFLILPDRDFSEQENRMLDSAPDFSFSSLFSGKFTQDFESYVTDQFAFRDGWISLKSRFEKFSGKTENNDVYFCSDGALITRFPKPDSSLVKANVEAVNNFAAACGANVYFSLIPGAVSIWADKLPDNAPNCDQRALIESIYAEINVPCVDNYSSLESHADDYIFYRTDHHWTSLGAYYGAGALLAAAGGSIRPLDSFSPTVLTDSFYGTVYSSSGVRWVEPDVIEAYVDSEGITVENYSSGSAEPGVVYDMDRLAVKDKYSVFFGGNTPLLKISTGNVALPKLLLIRDSYSDSELPFLFESFSEIYVVDLRYYRLSIKTLIEENDIDTVVINYALSNFATDPSVALISG